MGLASVFGAPGIDVHRTADDGLTTFPHGDLADLAKLGLTHFETEECHNFQDGAILGGQVDIVRSIASGNFNGIRIASGSAHIVDSAAVENQENGFTMAGQTTLESCVARGNRYGLVGFNGVVRLSKSTFTNNFVAGLTNNLQGAGGSLVSLGDNLIAGNGNDVSGTLVPLARQ